MTSLSSHWYSTKRTFRTLWKTGSEEKRKEAIGVLIMAAYYEQADAEPDIKGWQ